MEGKVKRLLAIGDLHTGSWCGLTPPHYDSPGASKASKARYKFRRELWNWYRKTIEDIAPPDNPVDCVLINGDAIDGSGHRSMGSEVIVPLAQQVEAATFACQLINVIDSSIHLTFGTAYHTGQEIDLESELAERLGGTIADRQYLKINGTTIRAVHHAGGGSLQGVHAYPARVGLINKLKAASGDEPGADILLFSHRHTYSFQGDADQFSVRLPCLQGPMSKFGRRCEGPYTMGVVLFEFAPSGDYSWKLHQSKLRTSVPQVLNI